MKNPADFVKKSLHAWRNDEAATLYKRIQSLAKLYRLGKYPMPLPTSLAIEGGGPRGRLYISAIEALTELRFNPEIVAGTSVGAIFSLLVGLGFSAKQIKEIAENINFFDLMDYRPNVIGDWLSGTWFNKIASLAYLEYLHSGDIFHFWGSHIIEEILGDPHSSFADLHAKVASGADPLLKDLIFTAVHAKNDTIQVFSFETTPNVRIVDALQASMTLPGIFQVRTVRNKDGSEFGKFVDGGVKINNPINVLDKSKYTHPNYPLQSTVSPYESTAVNPSALGLSLSWLYKLDPTITPINAAVKKEIDAYINENVLITTLQSGGLSLINWLKKQKAKVTLFMQYYKHKYWKYYDLGDIFRHIVSFNVGLPVFNKEDRAQKLKDHFPNTIQIWNLDMAPHETEYTEKQKQRADIVGRETVYSWWDTLHKPDQTYLGQYNNLSDDCCPSKLAQYLIEFILELEKYEDSNLKNHGYNPEELPQNVRIQFLTYKMAKILASFPSPETELNLHLQKAKAHQKETQDKIQLAQQKRECYLERAIVKKLMHAIQSRDNEKFKRAYHAQLGNGISRLTKPVTPEGYTLLHYIILEGEPSTLELALSLAKESIQQACQNGKKPLFSSMKALLDVCGRETLCELAAQSHDPRFGKVLSAYCPELRRRCNPLTTSYAQIKTSFEGLGGKVKKLSQQVASGNRGKIATLR